MNPVFLSALISWFTAQCLKTILNALVRKSLHNPLDVLASLLWRTGGMPSSHAALVTALTVSIGIYEGTGSTIFVLSIFFAVVVIRDALGVRLSNGRQARALNKLGKDLSEKLDIDFIVVKEIHGHTPQEVLAGILLGGGTAFIASLLTK